MAADRGLRAQERDPGPHVQVAGAEAEGVLHNWRSVVRRFEHEHLLSGWRQKEHQHIQPEEYPEVGHEILEKTLDVDCSGDGEPLSWK